MDKESRTPLNYQFDRIVTLAELERVHIETVLKVTFQGNKSSAARALGISLKTLYNKLEVYNKPAETPTEG